ncbi:MAG: three-Cys-motif partner protein TcmP [Lentimicrobiaceae bacterium]|nr:three-Cys-motif partner protein TcmP [Lentimicrobiaceae bacterium]
MAAKDLHDKPFDEATLDKLVIFEDYAKEWLPTFIMGGYKELWIFDFFSGPGFDINGVAGSPIRILQQVKNQIGNIFQKKTKVNLCFNDFDKTKFVKLTKACKTYIKDNPELSRANINIEYHNKDFDVLFSEKISTIKVRPSLVYIDQNGIKYLADKYLLELANTKETDFLYYVSSSYFLRFGETKEFKKNIYIDIEKAKKNPYKYVHKSILEQLKKSLPKESKLSLYPFTIKKGNNIYGIIFGATHIRAVDKFLKTAWKSNELNGEANFDINNDEVKSLYNKDLFGTPIYTKIEEFSTKLRDLILKGKINNNKKAYDFTLKEGHIDKHASEVISQMKRDGFITFDGRSPLVNYDQVYKNNRIVNYEIVNTKQ